MVPAAVAPVHAHDDALCISVVSHGQGVLVDRLLADLAALPPGRIARLIVTINLPADSWQPTLTIPGAEIEVLRNAAPLGFAANHNLAFAHCAEPRFAVVNPDIRLADDAFAPLLARLSADAGCALAVPVQVDAAGRRESFARAVPTPFGVVARRLFRGGRRGAAAERAQWVAGAFMVWRAEAFARLGGFDAGYFLYCEDVDICLRLQLAGGRFAIVEAACVTHDAQRASIASPRYLLQHVRSLLRLWSSPVFWRFIQARPRLAAVRA